jgi:hypothetical protein
VRFIVLVSFAASIIDPGPYYRVKARFFPGTTLIPLVWQVDVSGVSSGEEERHSRESPHSARRRAPRLLG